MFFADAWGVFWEQAFPAEWLLPQHKCEIVFELCRSVGQFLPLMLPRLWRGL